MGKLTLNLTPSFHTKYDRISLEKSCVLMIEIWRVRVSINCIFSWHLTQVPKCHLETISHCHISTSLHGMKFGIPLRISLYRYPKTSLGQKLIFDTINWTTWTILKMITYTQITRFFSWAKWCHLLSPFVEGYLWRYIPHRFLEPFMLNTPLAKVYFSEFAINTCKLKNS